LEGTGGLLPPEVSRETGGLKMNAAGPPVKGFGLFGCYNDLLTSKLAVIIDRGNVYS